MCKQFALYLRIKQSVGIFSLGRSLVQSIIRSSRIVHVDVCMTARQEKGKHCDIPRFHSDWAGEASLRSPQCFGKRTSRKTISKPACRTFHLHQARKAADVIVTKFGHGVHFRMSKWKMTLPERTSDVSHARVMLPRDVGNFSPSTIFFWTKKTSNVFSANYGAKHWSYKRE